MFEKPPRNEFPSLVIYGHVGFDVSVTPTKEVKVAGGAAYYATLAASLVSRSVGIVTVIGDDFPVAQLQSLQVNTDGVARGSRQSAVFYQEYSEGHEVVSFKGHLNACEELSPKLIPTHYIGARVFFIATAPPIQQRQILDWLVRRGFAGIIAIDTTLSYVGEFSSLLREHEKRIDILFINDEEYRLLGWLPPPNTTVVIKQGNRGAAFRENGSWAVVPAPKIDQAHSTTGAGDVLAGACLAGVAAGNIFKAALLKGVELATKSVTGLGVEHLRQETYDAK